MIRKLWLISKFMMSQAGKQIVTLHILRSILRSKDNQTMKFGHFVFCHSNVFLKKPSPRPFCKKNKIEHFPGLTAWNVIKLVLIVCLSRGLTKHIKTKFLTWFGIFESENRVKRL